MTSSCKLLFIAALCATLFNSCTKKNAEKTTSPHFLSFTSGTTSASSSTVSAGGEAGYKVTIQSTISGGTFLLYLNPYTGTTGTFPFNDSSSGAYYQTGAGALSMYSVHGSATITAVSPDIIGTFTYTGTDSVVVNGSFDVAAP